MLVTVLSSYLYYISHMKKINTMYHGNLLYVSYFCIILLLMPVLEYLQKQLKIHDFEEIQVRNSKLSVGFCPEIEIIVTHFRKQFPLPPRYLVMKDNLDIVV